MHRHLDTPADVDASNESLELLRAFAADGQLQVALSWDAWPDVSNWGVLLADLARHVANAREQQLGVPASATLAEIRLAFDDAWGWDADTDEGSVRGDDDRQP